MATYGSTVRRGLPRVKGGEPWPVGGAAPVQATAVRAAAPAATEAVAPAAEAGAPAAPAVELPVAPAAAAAPVASAVTVRRGLPRVPGGEPWPPASLAPAGVQVSHSAASEPATPQVATPERTAAVAASGVALRRGLPRTPGGEPWPPAGVAPAAPAQAAASVPATTAPVTETPAANPGRRTGLPRPGTSTTPTSTTPAAAPVAVPTAAEASAAVAEPEVLAPLPFPQTVFPTAGAAAWNRERQERQGKGPITAPEPVRHGPFTTPQWVGAVIVGGAGLLFAAAMVVLAVRWFISLEFMQDFLATYPGEYHLPETAPVGIPTWIGWQHFFNVFLIVLIIRSGLQVRHVKRPTAFWAPKNNPKGKISLSLWFHQSLDILWFVNGVIFVVLLFVTGQWMRIVPTSWEVIPNAISAGLQYVSLDWPTENGWVNYNSLQQLAYFATVFLAAPLAAITGVRMSGIWPKNAKGLNKAYPVEWARAVHFPVMLYFCLFIVVHVTLVFATGALRNLNHMYGGQDAINWTGFWIFAASMVVIAAAWVAARPLVLAPIARLFGNVSGR